MSKIENMNIPYNITWVTHNSRISERMIKYKVKRGEPLLLSMAQEIEVTSYVSETIRNKKLVVLAYNISVDHIHLVLVCNPFKRDTLVGRLKSDATTRYKYAHNIREIFHLWAQKYNRWIIKSNQQLLNTIEYIRHNRAHHSLLPNPGLRSIVTKMLTGMEDWCM